MTLGARIAALEREIVELRARQLEQLVITIAMIAGPGVAFSAADVWQLQGRHPELRILFDDLAVHSPKQLGKALWRCRGCGLTRIGRNGDGVLWLVACAR